MYLSCCIDQNYPFRIPKKPLKNPETVAQETVAQI